VTFSGKAAPDAPPPPAGAGVVTRTRASLDRAEGINQRIQAFLHLDRAGAIDTAFHLDRQPAAERGPLFGLPVAVKDNIAVRGLPSTCASAVLRAYRAPYDATVVERLREAGAVILGTANLDEFAMGSATTSGFRGATRNPVDPARIVGGSSGGPAAAVASGAVPAALGTDTGGSVRLPAAHTGIFGIRPTYGRVSRFGITAYASSFDQVGCLATKLSDLARVLAVVSGLDPRDATSAQREVPDFTAAAGSPALPRTVVACSDEDLAILDPPSRAAFQRVLHQFEDGGAVIRRIRLPEASTTISAYYVLACAEASSNLARFDGMRYGSRVDGDGTLAAAFRESRTAGFGDEVRLRILLGTTVLSQGYRDAVYAAAAAARRRVQNRLLRAFEQGDLLLLPISKGSPRRLADPVEAGEDYDGDRFTVLASLAGFPALAVPAGERNGLPFGVELMAPPWNEASLLAAAAAFGAIPGSRRPGNPSPGAAASR
jgi:aspartyl-tRNA(Asn)/glutamyl-tRNA(Gln) amidotransferase subunit A